VGAVFHHEDPASAPFPDGSREAMLMRLLHLARQIGAFCHADDAARHHKVQDLVFGAARIGIDSDALCMLADQVVSEWREWGRILEVATGEVPAFATIQPAESAPHKDDAAATAVMASAARAPGEPLRVLVVDDDAAVVALLQHLLKEQGHEVTVARDGREALKYAIAARPQMILCDWIIPEMDGLTLCRALREAEEGRQIYFLLLTGMEKDEHLVEAFAAGVDDFVTKPFSPRVLLARLSAGQRVVHLQEEAARDSQNLRRFATELAVANRRLRQAALTDPLTGLPNRRYAMERIEQEWAAANRNQRPLSLMMIDLDRFKLVNDTHGHDVGDMLLRQTALLLRKAVRTEDVICRLGGEEFLVISPDTPLMAATRLGDRLRKAIGDAPVVLGNLRYPVTVSLGVAERTPVMARYDELLKAADQVLYHAKRMGGNRVAAAGADSPVPGGMAAPG
jgi:diguanylate cyclase (GGDEF)-like protein